jgi:hypothetical protein
MNILITERQKNLLTETMSAALRRRLSPENIKDHIDSIVNYDIDVCEWEDVGECISDVGDMVVHSIELDMLEVENEISSKEKDMLWHHVIDNYGSYIKNLYVLECK